MNNLGWENNRRIRYYGKRGPFVIVLHGGPAASGTAAPIASVLGRYCRAIEPWQRSSGRQPLTVKNHVDDLHAFIKPRLKTLKPMLVGDGWGATLALAYAATYPDTIGAIALIGAGPFDSQTKDQINMIRLIRIKKYLESHPTNQQDFALSREQLIFKYHDMTDSYHLDQTGVSRLPTEPFDIKAYMETRNDVQKCLAEGWIPEAFQNIISPVKMFHGAYDPCVGKSVYQGLRRYIPDIEYESFMKCGHQPVLEKYARKKFFRSLIDWLLSKEADSWIGPSALRP